MKNDQDSPIDLQRFNILIAEYSKYNDWMKKARSLSHDFSPDVVEKVINDYQIKCEELEKELSPMKGAIEKEIERLNREKEENNITRISLNKDLEEAKLRHLIGEIDDANFEKRKMELEGNINELEERISRGENDIKFYSELLNKTLTNGETVGEEVYEIDRNEEPPPSEERVDFNIEEELAGLEEEEILDKDMDEDRGDMSDEGMIEMNLIKELSLEDEAKGLEKELEELKQEVKEEEISQDLKDDIKDIGKSIDHSADETASTQKRGEVRRAQLIFMPGLPEQKIYPLLGDTITIGRGRDNDIPIKDDIKVSRYHCKILRTDAGFFLEDMRSSNGTFLNNEPVTSSPLKDGDYITIGDTSFSFVIK